MKARIKYVVATIMCSILVLQLSVTGYAANLASTKTRTYTYEELPVDEILCYYKGLPVYKENVTEDFRIMPETMIVPYDTQIERAYKCGAIKSEYRGMAIVVSGELSAPQYGQNDLLMYLPHDSAQAYARELEGNNHVADYLLA